MGNGFELKALTESFAVTAHSAVNEIESQRALRAQRKLRNSIAIEAIIESFAVSAGLAVN